MYSKQRGTITEGDGVAIEVIICHVDIDPKEAERLFSEGQEVGDWHWKHQVWTCRDVQHLEEVRAAARYYYGWDGQNEKVTALPDGGFEFEAYYCC